MAELSRRRFMSAAALAAATAPLLPTAAAHATAPGGKARRSGTIADVEHVVIVMQENRSFDHYYGSLGGVRGFGDRQSLRYPGGGTIFTQPDLTRSDGGTLLPFHMDTSKVDAQDAGDLDHSWEGTHAAWDLGAWDNWVGVKGEETMGYFTRADIPFQYALADAFTICDSYHCSIQGPTTPNRLYHWTGMIDPDGTQGGPAISNPDDYNPVYSWKTYPERLQEAGVSWQVYANDEVGDDGAHPFVGDYGDNPLWLFQAYHDALASTDPAVHQLAERASLRTAWKPDSGLGGDVRHVLSQFIGDCHAGTLPTVSWVVAPYGYSEHPQARPVDGAAYVNAVLQALWAKPQLWESTAVILNFDENDGFFDHVIAPTPPAGTPAEFVAGLPIGLGPRVPMTVVSPWSRGGWVNSEVFDHTSVLRFLEVFTGVHEPNISPWRRAVCGDLTSCFDFTSFDPSVPTLPNVKRLQAEANRERVLPAVTAPAPGQQVVPRQELRTRRRRVAAYRLDGNASVDHRTGAVVVTLDNRGARAAALGAYDANVVPFVEQPLLIGPHARATVPAVTVSVVTATTGYDLSVHGPDGFLRSFAGSVLGGGLAGGGAAVGVASVTGTLVGDDPDVFLLALSNTGRADVRFALSAQDFGSARRAVRVAPGQTVSVRWATAGGRYDVAVQADSAGHDTGLVYRFAGRT